MWEGEGNAGKKSDDQISLNLKDGNRDERERKKNGTGVRRRCLCPKYTFIYVYRVIFQRLILGSFRNY